MGASIEHEARDTKIKNGEISAGCPLNRNGQETDISSVLEFLDFMAE